MEQQVEVPDGFFPWDDIPDSGLLPEGIFQMRGESMEFGLTSTEKKRCFIQAVVEEPKEAVGLRMFENFTIGTEEDPMARKLETWKYKSVGAKILKNNLCNAANIARTNSEEDLKAGFAGCMFVVEVFITEDKDGDWKGTKRNKFQYYKVGERQVGVKGSAIGKVPAPQAPGAGAPPIAPLVAPAAAPPPPSVAPPVETAVKLIPCDMCKQMEREKTEYAPEDYRNHLNECIQAFTVFQESA